MFTTAAYRPAYGIQHNLFTIFFIAMSLAGFGQAATKVVITTAPVVGPNGSLMSVQPVVEIRDASNARVTNSTAQVQIVIASGTGGSIGGTTIIHAVNGVATFTDLTFTGTGGQSYTFEFRSQPVIASEPFEYTGGSSLTGQNGGFGWSGAWFGPNPAFPDDIIDATGLTYTGFTSSGGRASYSSGTGGDAGRVLATASNAAYNTVWLVFLGNYTQQGGGFNSFRLLINASSTLTGGIGGNNNYADWTILDNTLNNTVFTTAAFDGSTRLALLKIDYTAGISYLWMDPMIASFDGTQTPSLTANFAPVFDRIDFYNRNAGISTDEIILASTYKAALHLEQNLTSDLAIITALPVQWSFFTATCNGVQTLLEWATSSEHNNSQFIVERSRDASHWLPIGKVQGARNSSINQQYKYDDSAFSVTTYYRLQQVDLDGAVNYSKIISVNCGTSPANRLSIFPNPVYDILQFKGAQAGLPYQLIDVKGRPIRTGQTQRGSTMISLAGLPDGSYILTVPGSNSQPVNVIKVGR